MNVKLDRPFENTGGCWLYGGNSNRLEDCMVAGRTVREWIVARMAKQGIRVVDDAALMVNIECLPDLTLLKRVAQGMDDATWQDAAGRPLAWTGEVCDNPVIITLHDDSYQGIELFYPWHLLDFAAWLLEESEISANRSQISPLAHTPGLLKLGAGSVVQPGVVIEGRVVIGENCRIGPNCYIRGNTVIGDHCVIGQSVEVKSSLIGNRTWISHLSYVGDSVIGDDVNFGAGSVCSNYRHDGKTHRVMVGRELVETGRDKLGAMIGDGVKLGCHTIVYPGRIIEPGLTTLPGQIVTHNLISEA